MSEHTPTISDLREAWLSAEFEERDSTTSDDDLRAEFDRALAAHDAEVWDQGHEAGWDNACIRIDLEQTKNPYRKATE